MTRNQDPIFQIIKNVKENEFNKDSDRYSGQGIDPKLLNPNLNNKFTMFELQQALLCTRSGYHLL